MNLERLRELLDALQQGRIDVDGAVERLKDLPFDDLPFARFDTHRLLRTGMEEVIYTPGKRPEQMEELIRRSLTHHDAVLATRVEPELAGRLLPLFPQLRHNHIARTLSYRGGLPSFPGQGRVAVVTAGTADLPVAEEAAVTLEHLGSPVLRVTDVGVAGIHRLFDKIGLLRGATVVLVVAGMDGALPGVVAGLVERPVVAVPTSVGAGAHLGGLAPLLTMLNTCSPGVSVVNIDNG
ncbi:MAG: nickel pincer cofactor biosynthesis protein LarB, partial [Deltaproteobacteria bacterium]|nr:nickel pincer cofactor biosynthesis protein LarB [Deltaproteobacteria bacterium]